MNPRLQLLRTSANPIAQVFSLLVVGLVVIGAVLMGAVILAFLLGLAVIAAAAFAIRLWWLRRKVARAGKRTDLSRSSERYIETEYRVIEERRSRQERD